MSDDFKIVKIKAGLGNQMFQYAFGKYMEQLLGVKVLFDKISFYEIEFPNNSYRSYSLDIFENLDIEFATLEQIVSSQGENNLSPAFSMCFNIPKPYHWVEKLYSNFYDVTKLNKYNYFEGYFQNENYLLPIENHLRSVFVFPPFKDSINEEYAKKIKNSNNPVFIHLRRSDYLPQDILNSDYYNRAIKIIKSKVENPTFWVFGAGCSDFAENELKLDCDWTFVGQENVTLENHYEDMRLMSLCKHGILANSTYSWWSAWLSNNKAGTFIAPSPWVLGADDIICKNWIKIER